jgi:2-methylcitrate dehydratase PrpD
MNTIEEIWADRFSYDRLKITNDILRRFAYYFLDSVSVMLAGSREPPVLAIAEVVRRSGRIGSATVIGADFLASPWDAAFINAAAAHVLEYDDDHRLAVLHPGAVIVPAALAAAEDVACPGERLLTGLVAGYELTCQLGQLDGGNLFHKGFHPSSVFGTVGAALATSFILGLPPVKIVEALGTAASQASGLTCWEDDNWAKPLNLAHAASNGVMAAYLAREGFRGPTRGITGRNGLVKIFIGEEVSLEPLLHRLGERFAGIDTAVKFYPCCRFAHGAVDLAIEASRVVALNDVERIEVDIFDTTVLHPTGIPKSSTEAAFNIPFLVSQAFLHGKLELAQIRSADDFEASQNSLIHKIMVRIDPNHTARFPDEYLTTLTFRGRDRSILWKQSSRLPSGDPHHERYRTVGAFEQEVEQKAYNLLKASFSKIDIKRTIKSVLDVANMEVVSVDKLIHHDERR